MPYIFDYCGCGHAYRNPTDAVTYAWAEDPAKRSYLLHSDVRAWTWLILTLRGALPADGAPWRLETWGPQSARPRLDLYWLGEETFLDSWKALDAYDRTRVAGTWGYKTDADYAAHARKWLPADLAAKHADLALCLVNWKDYSAATRLCVWGAERAELLDALQVAIARDLAQAAA